MPNQRTPRDQEPSEPQRNQQTPRPEDFDEEEE